jgi:hypothetical protein
MYTQIQKRFEQIKKETKWLHTGKWKVWHNGLPFPAIPTKVDNNYAPTLFLINLVSLFDEALELYVDCNFSSNNPKHRRTFRELLKKLDSQKLLKDYSKCETVGKWRNNYAHEFGQYSNWDEFTQVLNCVESELRILGIVN